MYNTTKTVAFMVKNSSAKEFVLWLKINSLPMSFTEIHNSIEPCRVCTIEIPYPGSEIIIKAIENKLVELDKEVENAEKEAKKEAYGL